MMILWLTLTLAVSHAGATSEAEAAALFRAGEARYHGNDAAGALKLFEASYRLVPVPLLLVDIAQCLRKLGRDREAAEAYRRFLESRSGGRRLRAEVFEALDQLGGRGERAVASDVRAGARERAAALFQRGRARYQQGDFEGALMAFQAAHSELATPDLLVNIAQCQRKLDRPDQAILAYHSFLSASSAPHDLRLEVWEALDETLTELDARLYRLAESAALLERELMARELSPEVRRSTEATVRQIRRTLMEIDASVGTIFR
jgi:tetratricopeptide (TPR) repeat protein